MTQYPDLKRANDFLQEHLREAHSTGAAPEERFEVCIGALRMFPFSMDAYHSLGCLFEQDYGDLDNAAVCFAFARDCAFLLWPELETMEEVSLLCEACRPYLQTLCRLSAVQMRLGRYDQALEIQRYVRRVEPTDLQGNSFRLFTSLIAQGHFQEALDLSHEWSSGDERECCDFCWGTVLLEYRRHRQGQCSSERLDDLLVIALDYNNFVPELLLRRRPLPSSQPFTHKGKATEALGYLEQAKAAWQATEGALQWLKGKSKGTKTRPDNACVLYDLLARGKVLVFQDGPNGGRLREITTSPKVLAQESIAPASSISPAVRGADPKWILCYATISQDIEDGETLGSISKIHYDDIRHVHFWEVKRAFYQRDVTASIVCNNCLHSGAKMRCGRCEVVRYCSQQCQKKHWKSHHKHLCYDPDKFWAGES